MSKANQKAVAQSNFELATLGRVPIQKNSVLRKVKKNRKELNRADARSINLNKSFKLGKPKRTTKQEKREQQIQRGVEVAAKWKQAYQDN